MPPPFTVGIVTYNTMMSVPVPIRFNGINQRKRRLGPCLYSHVKPNAFDIICFQELVFGADHVLKSMVHHPHHSSTFRSSLLGPKIRLWPSGLYTASRYPIIKEQSYVFTGRTYHVEAVVSKGAVYCCIQHPVIGHLHVVNTHLNAWTTGEAHEARVGQVGQIRTWMESLRIPRHEPLVVCGDWNVDFYECRDHMLTFCDILGGVLALPETVQFSLDGQTNTLVGLDDPSEYRTWKEQHGCYEDVLSSSVGRCMCCPRQLLDGFVLVQEPNTIQKTKVQVIQNKSNLSYPIQFDLSTTRMTRDVSDHYPSLLTFRMNPVTTTGRVVMDDSSRAVVYHDGQWELLTLFCVLITTTVLYFALGTLLELK